MQPALIALVFASFLAGPPSDASTPIMIIELPAGGWATITPDPLPASVSAGAKVELNFLVKQHGVTPLAGLKPKVLLNQRDEKPTTFAAAAGKSTGWYTATLTFPEAGAWHITIESGFGNSKTTMPVQRVTAAIAADRTGNRQ